VPSLKGLLVDAAAWNVDPSSDIAPIRGLLDQGCDLEADVVPTVGRTVREPQEATATRVEGCGDRRTFSDPWNGGPNQFPPRGAGPHARSLNGIVESTPLIAVQHLIKANQRRA
jgi:hypothetical protein